ncbi:MAG TPA: sigma-70 family RNA polymerase sigma factor [Firmicutes bacterium]|nr:sigma-70 family RNA polymerase sigma factor [Bacillota bacterium]
MWQELYEVAYHYLLRLGLASADAEDLAQEALVSTYLHLDGIQQGKLRAYVLAAARSKYLDFVERRHRDCLLTAREGYRVACARQEAECLEDKERVQAAMERLKPTEKKVFLMKYYMGLSAKEIASLMGTSADCVKTTLWRLRRRLKSYFEGEDG